ncbi:MAG: polyprenyl synthetase family protein [Candidatus Nanoarchaeia archaeon]|nr:polyprenyl synthetase family protein [Candidatus Nanoarchaeia archaeon]
MDFSQKVKEFTEMIDAELEFFFEEKRKEYSESEIEMLQIIKDFVLRGGKRIRPICMLIGYCLEGNKLHRDIIRASLSTELLHNYFLIHDDIMDEASLRRGKITVHKFFENYYENTKDDKRKFQYGNSMAILAGDILCVYAYDCIAKCDFEDNKKMDALKIINETIIKTIHGQNIDVISGELNKDISQEDYMKMINNKTAEYTFTAPLKIGMTLAGVDSKIQKAITQYARFMGRAFQLQDDLMDIYSEKEFGKKKCGDISEGKRTLFVNHVLENGTDEDVIFIRSVLGKKNLSEQEIEKIRDVFNRTGAGEKVVSVIDESIDEAKKIINSTVIDKGAKIFLIELAEYIRNRKV